MKRQVMSLKMAQKLMLSSAVSLLLMLLLGLFAYSGLRSEKMSLTDIYGVRFKTYEICARHFTRITSSHANLYKLISWANANYDQKKVADLGQEVQKTLAESKAALSGMLKTPDITPKEKKLVQEILVSLEAYSKGANDLIDMLQADLNAATMYMATADSSYQEIHKNFKALLDEEKSLSEHQYAGAMQSFNATSLLVIGLLIAALIISFTSSVILNRLILGPVRQTVEVIRRVAGGDFTRRIEVDSGDEIGQMARDFNELVAKLNHILNSVAGNATKVSAAATQLHASSELMATGAQEVAAQAGSVATASEEMAATTQEIAQNCHLAAQRSDEANHSAGSGSTVVAETVKGMERIVEQVNASATIVAALGDRSNQIGEIIGTIEDIADQTNLLALNAAIEAARAGEMGRGFAVVADEVRALAERTTKATREIGDMIKSIQQETRTAVGAMGAGVKEVENGTRRAAESGEALQEILHRISDVTTRVNQIAIAAEEQTATTGEISSNMQQITDIVNSTARGAQESTQAASDLSQLAQELQRLVGQFKLAA